jgi:uncharacterized protein YceH (UPF0502 family)
MELTAEEQRVMGCLLEKQVTVPDSYPMTLNALVTACNQSSNRWPVVTYDDRTVSDALARLRERGVTRVVHPSHGARTAKYRHVLDEVLRLEDDEKAVIAVLLLRGPQTVSEVRTRSERLFGFASADDVQATIDRLARREEPLVAALPRGRFAHRLGGEVPADVEYETGAPAAAGRAPRDERLAALEAEVAELRRHVTHLYAVLGEDPPREPAGT